MKKPLAANLDIVTVLRVELSRRSARRPGYSMRAFARDLGMSGSHLCGVLTEKKKLSMPTLLKVCRRLKLDSRATVDVLASSIAHWYQGADGPQD